MMTKEDVASIVTYCEEHKISFKQRIEELGIPAWSFYEAKRKHFSEASNQNGEFLQLAPGTFSPLPNMTRRSPRAKTTCSDSMSMLSVEMKTITGTMLRIQGEMSPSMLGAIIQSAGGNVQSR